MIAHQFERPGFILPLVSISSLALLLAGLVGRLVGLQAGLALTGAAALGGAIRTMNNLAQQMESGGLSTDALSNNTLGGVAAIGMMGGNVRFNSATGDVIGSITVDRPGSRLPDTRTGVICNVRTSC